MGDHDASTPLAEPVRSDPPAGLIVRPPLASERRAWRMLLPEAASSPSSSSSCRVLVAEALFGTAAGGTEHPRVAVVGAVSVSDMAESAPIQWPRVCVHVIPPLRRRGVGGALLRAAAAAERCRGLGRDAQGRPGPLALAAWSTLPPDDPAMASWRSAGFTRHVTLCEHELPLERLIARLDPLRERLRSAGRIPEDARVVPLAQTSRDQREQLVALHLADLGGDAANIRTQLEHGRPTSAHPDISMVALQGGRTVGFGLARLLSEGISTFEATAVEPAQRTGWANPLIRLAAARSAIARGATVVRFQSCDHHVDTRKFAKRLGADLRRELWLPYRVFLP